MFKISKILIITIFTTLLLTIFISSCSPKQEKIIKKDKFVRILSELMIIERLNISENEKLVLINQAFEKYKVTREQFQRTQNRYQEDPDFWIEVYEGVTALLKAQADSLSEELLKKPPEDYKKERK